MERLDAVRPRSRDLRAMVATPRQDVLAGVTVGVVALPLALAFGEGAEVRSPMAITVIGGLLVSTLLTLVVIPVVYDLLDRKPDEHYLRRGQRARRGIAAVVVPNPGVAAGEGAQG